MNPKCQRCGETVIQWNGDFVHRFNLMRVCPAKSGMLQLADEPYAKDATKIDGQTTTATQAPAKETANADVQPDRSPESGTPEETGRQENNPEAGDEDENDEDENSKNENDKNEEDKSSDENKNEEDKSNENKNDENENSQAADEEDEENKWALAAAKDINRFWQERVRLRGYRPTDEELADIMLRHAPKGRGFRADV
jgi:cobalamin biosynthesis protein CobT